MVNENKEKKCSQASLGLKEHCLHIDILGDVESLSSIMLIDVNGAV